MQKFQSRLTDIVFKIPPANPKLGREEQFIQHRSALYTRLPALFQQQMIESGMVTEEEFRKFDSVLDYIKKRDRESLAKDISFEEADQMVTDQRFEMFEEHERSLFEMNHADSFNELDEALWVYEQFMNQHFQFKPGELELFIRRNLEEYSEMKRQIMAETEPRTTKPIKEGKLIPLRRKEK